MFDRVLVVVRSVRVRSCGRLLLVMRRCMEMGLTSYVFVVLRSEEVWTALVGDCLRMEFMCGARPCTLDQNVLSREGREEGRLCTQALICPSLRLLDPSIFTLLVSSTEISTLQVVCSQRWNVWCCMEERETELRSANS
jgi:hypothetical protein